MNVTIKCISTLNKQESEVGMSGGREFHRRGADRLKALDPMVVKLAEEDRRVREGV